MFVIELIVPVLFNELDFTEDITPELVSVVIAAEASLFIACESFEEMIPLFIIVAKDSSLFIAFELFSVAAIIPKFVKALLYPVFCI